MIGKIRFNKMFAVLVTGILFISAEGQINSSKLLKANLPKSISYKGTFLDCITWNDLLGKNIVLLTETGAFIGKNQNSSYTDCEGTCRDAELYAYHYILKGDSVKVVWKLEDFERTCPFDVMAEFSKNSLVVTDLNRNNIGEVWFVYKLTCTSDVSPATMKLFMYENENKHAIRGTSKLIFSKNEIIGGEMKLDEKFKNSSLQVQKYARQLWKQFEIDKLNFIKN